MRGGSNSPQSSIAESEREAEAWDARNSALARKVEQLPAEASRLSIARWIIGSFIVLVGVDAFLFCAAAIWPRLGHGLTEAAGGVRELANTLVLPIVTLVFGYYFGKRAE